MALSRYEIRNEFSLADAELYKSADKDDPEALLEGVAMAGLVGLLRQLGDLSQFAAELFHNLHEEVMATAARGHSLKSRIQLLEVEFPLIEKAFLSQTNHSAFFYTAGVDWHPNMHIDQNYITREDLPCFMMDSYEEARGPPRLFLLDKFDVVGEGACLKRYTDPSFCKVETAALGITNTDVQRDKKLRKGKRRGSRRRDAETPEVIPTPHAKLHQLLLEEWIENRVNSDPARRVKLKRRLNGFPFALKTGQSYMKKILLDPPPEFRELHEVCYPSPLRLLDNNLMPEHEKDEFGPESLDVELAHKSPSMSPDSNNEVLSDSIMEMKFDTSNESDHFKPEFEKDEIGLKSPSLQLTHGNPSMTPHMRDDVPNISTDKQEFDAFDIESKCMPKAQDGLEVGNITSIRYEDVVEKQVMVDKGRKSEGSTGYQSDDVGSEVENYMDALATMESEREIDSELRTKGNLNVLRNRKSISDPDAATPLHQARSSDSQSMESSTLSDDGNSSSRKCKSNSSYSSSPHFLDKKAHVVDVVSDEINSFYETGEAKSISRPLKWRGRNRNAGGSKVTAIPNYSSDDIEHTFTSTDVSPGVFVHRDADELGETEVSQLKSGPLFAQGVRGAEPSNAVESESNMSPNTSDSTSSETPLRTEYDSSFRVVAENQSSDNGEIKHLTEHSSSAPISSDDTCFTGRSGDQHMEEVVDKQIYLLIDPSLTSLTSDGAPLDCEENLSSSPKYQPPTELANDNLSMSEHPSKPSPKAPFETELREDLPNDESGARQVLGVLYRESLYPSSCTEDTADEVMIQLSLPNRPQAGGRENDFEAYPIVNQSDLQMTIVPLAEEQTTELRLPELETNDKAIDTVSTDANLVKAVSPSKEVEVEERPMSPFRRDLCSKNFRIFGITDILQPLDPAGRLIDNQIEEQFSDMSDKQFPDTSLSDTEDCSAGAHFNDIILDRSTVALPDREITVDMRDQALPGIPKVGDTIDIQASVVLDSVPQSVDTSDNGDEIPHKLPALAVTVEKGVSASGETDLGTESLKHCALNEIQASETADDMLLHKAARVEVSSDQIINLHELERLVGEELEGVAFSKELGESITADGESIAEEQKVRQETNSHLIGKEGISGVDSIYFSRNLLGQQLGSELFPREKPTIDGVGQHNKPIGSISLALGLLPEAVNTDIGEMPPLPPLPPVEWRMGKNQQACLAHEQAVLQNNNILFPSSSMSVADQRAEAPELILPSYAKAAENSLLAYESTSDTLDHDSWALGESQPIDQNLPFPGSNSNLLSLGALQSLHNNLLLPENEADLAVTEFHSPNQDLLLPANNKFPSLSETQSVCQNLPLPAKLDEMHQYDDHTGTSLNACSSLSDGDAASVCDVELLVDSETLVQFHKAKETNQNKVLGQGSASSQSNTSTHNASALPPKIENEQPHNMILCLEGEVGWPAQDEFEQSRVLPMKLPRQRNPLIDAVIALDKSKLRKVTEQPRTQIQKASDRDSGLENLQLRKVTEQPRTQIQKADERDSELVQLKKVTEQPMTEIQKADVRDSLLEQIRARSFNLKPTVVSRPGVQGPTTNLKVAAILEKAKIIRQAFAGSDEDDDDDSWSDS